MNVKSKVLKIRNLPTGSKKVDEINAKPYLFLIVFLLIGIVLLFTDLYLIGIVISFLFLYCLLFIRNVTLVEFYEDYAVFYLNNGNEECFILFWEDITSWNIANSRFDLDVVNIELRNCQCISLKCVSVKKVKKYFSKYAPFTQETSANEQHAL